jgi:pimeloyl-ACP methyl ester carboxylesterase
MSRGFAYYRAGAGGMADSLRKLMQPLATDVEGGTIEDCGHFILEEQPEDVARKLLDFFGRVETSAI